jgi:hypothetical protein
MSLLNNLKDPITDLIGLLIMLFTLFEVYQGNIQWIWEGYAGMGIGLILFMFPDKMVMDFLQKIVDKFTRQ